jgi:hypothetical protein
MRTANPASSRVPRVIARLVIGTLGLTITLAQPALAGDNGEGLAGETTDKLVTFFSLGVVVFFALVVITGSAIQAYLERRKEAQKALDLRRRVGW